MLADEGLADEGVVVAKPVSGCEAIIWASTAVALVCAVITALVQHNRAGAWVSLMAALVMIIMAGAERRRVQRRAKH
ncbi:hypothetical protein AB0I55_18135 [Actinocatenispora sera]|uniref:hypothetical protein n=1 Tax=Actinocatenispora sera TaxID=390989 RepID=UPI00340DD533